MHAEKSNFTLTRMARLLEVSRSGYYAWVSRAPSPASVRRACVEQKVSFFHGVSDETYGAPRILADLREDGETISRKTVASMMKRLGLVGVSPRKWRTTTVTDRTDTYPADVVKRQWDTGALNQVWVGDITYLRTWEGWLYLAVVIDAHSRRVIGWAMAEHMRADLVEDALLMAITLRESMPDTVVFHTDRLNPPSTHLTKSPSSLPTMASPGRWDTPGCAGVTSTPTRSMSARACPTASASGASGRSTPPHVSHRPHCHPGSKSGSSSAARRYAIRHPGDAM